MFSKFFFLIIWPQFLLHLFLLVIPIPAVNSSLEQFEEALRNSYDANSTYIAPSVAELNLAVRLFDSIFETRNFNSTDVSAWASLGFSIERVEISPTVEFAIIYEMEKKGRGFYAINLSWQKFKKQQLEGVGVQFLQAPHRPSDLYTYEIVSELFITGHYLASSWSTTHRDVVDLCKEPASYFNSFTIAGAKFSANGSSATPPFIVQLHGFEKSSHNTTADIIFSSTKVNLDEVGPNFEIMYNCLKEKLGPGSGSEWNFNVYKYPEEIQILGGTLNINAANFYNTSNSGDGIFYHVETSRELRNVLYVNPSLRQIFDECF